jgi:[protein-PII] uridylyltransferase
LRKLERDLASLMASQLSPQELVAARVISSRSRRPAPPVLTEVLFDHHASEHYTVIEVLAEDRPGLLFTLAAALHEMGITIGVAKISTEGKRAVDVLYACESDGSKIDPGERSDVVREKLIGSLAADRRSVAS